MAKMISLKSKSTGLIGEYPESHLGLDDDLIPVDSEGNICLPCMGVKAEDENDKDAKASTNGKDKK